MREISSGWGGPCRVEGRNGGDWERGLGTTLGNKMADDGFQVVKKGKGYKWRNYKEKNGSGTKMWNSRTSNETIACDTNQLRTKIEKCRHDKGLLL